MLDAALALIEREGADAPTLRGVAKLAGVSQAAPYRHFRNKDALLAAVAEEGFRAMTEAMGRHAAPQRDDPAGRLRALGLAYIEFATRHPAHFRVMFGRVPVDRSAHPSLLAAALETFGLLLGTIRECQAAGLVRTGTRTTWRSAPGRPSMACPRWPLTEGSASVRGGSSRWSRP